MNIYAYNYQQYDLETDLKHHLLLPHDYHPSHLNLKQKVQSKASSTTLSSILLSIIS
jgi:hypothetical protein